ncbi:MAG: ABC transporter permease [Lentisphaeria bacterium]|nr:ABC transporter permease [Lentisphaeria bacterium]
MIEQKYSAEPFIRNPKRLFSTIYRDLKNSKELAFRLFVRNISAQYRHSFLGYFWAFVPPIVTALIWIVLHYSKVINLPQTSEIPYPIYVFAGTMLWRCFIDAVNMPLNSFSSAEYMLSKIPFPHEALFLSGLANLLFNSLIRILILVFVLLILGCSFSVYTLFFPVFLSALLILGCSLGLLLVPLGMIYDDVSRIMGFGLQFLFYVTPVVYVLPSRWSPLNPIASFIDFTRTSLVGLPVTVTPYFMITLLISLISFLFGWILLKITMPHIIERISS